MSEIDPNPDTPLVSAYHYNFLPRLRQPGGRKLRVCRENLAWPTLAPACQCAVFDNWGRPDSFQLSFCGWSMTGSTGCGTNCDTLNTGVCLPGGIGQGPFTLAYKVDDPPQLIPDSDPPSYAGGGVQHILPSGAFSASGDGYSCYYQTDSPLPISDACGTGGAVNAGFLVGYDTTAGTFAQLFLIGASGIVYYCWTWLLTGVPPGKLDCSGNGPAAYQISNGLIAAVGTTNPLAIVVDGVTIGQQYGYEYGTDDNKTAECGPFLLPFLCDGCDNPPSGDPPGNYPGTQAGATVGVSCAGAGTNEVAPPCCCGNTTKDQPPPECQCVWLCLANTDPTSNCTAAFELCRDPESTPICYSGDGGFMDASGSVSATFCWNVDTGEWDLTVSCLADPLHFQKFPGASAGVVSGGTVSAAGCCPSGNFDVSLACHPINCPPHPLPMCACTDPVPEEVIVTLPQLTNTPTGTCYCPRCASYAGAYALGYVGRDTGTSCDMTGSCTGNFGYHWQAWIQGLVFYPDDRLDCSFERCKYTKSAGDPSCPQCGPLQFEPCNGGVVAVCPAPPNTYNPFGPAPSRLDFRIDCFSNPVLQLSYFFYDCSGELVPSGLLEWSGPGAFYEYGKCCPQINLILPPSGYGRSGLIAAAVGPCKWGDNATVEAVCD